MVADGKKDWQVPEWCDLVLNEIIPRGVQIGIHGKLAARRAPQHVLVKISERAEVAKVPVELSAISRDPLGDSGHHDVAAVTGISGDRKPPFAGLCPRRY